MPACLSRSLGFAAISLKMDSDQNSQPIIFSSSCLRRTLSADMASEKWKSQSGLKKSASLENIHFQEEDENDNGWPGFGFGSGFGSGAIDEIWSSIEREQGNKKKEEEEEEETEKPRSQTDIWSSILSQKAVNDQDANNTAHPYIHPLMKRSSSLSEKSLEVCTESLGSETGSDIFSPDPDSDSGQEELKDVMIVEASKETEVKVVAVKTKGSVAGAGSPSRSFPPPLPSLSNAGDGSNVQMRSHRENGRLVLEAVSVPSNNCFKANRHDGRLLLTFSDRHVSDSDVADVDTERDEFENGDVIEDESDAEEEEEDDDVAIGAHKFLSLTKTVNDDTWQRRLNNRVVNTLEDNEGRGLNPYVYSWRTKPGPGPTVMEAHRLGDDVEGKRAGKVEEEVIPLYLRGCNLQQPRRPVLLWEAHCIAT